MPQSSLRRLSNSSKCGYQVQNVYRWYNSQSGDVLEYDHFYTLASSGELAPSIGYTYEQIGFQTLVSQQDDAVPLYRLYKQAGGHFYTTSTAEKNSVIQNLGFALEGNIGFIFSSQVDGTVALHRYYHASLAKHFYTLHPENESLGGWTDEGVIGYAFDSNGSADC